MSKERVDIDNVNDNHINNEKKLKLFSAGLPGKAQEDKKGNLLKIDGMEWRTYFLLK